MRFYMRAMVLPKFGDAELFQLKDIPKPSPGSGEILVKVIAASVNPVDAKIRENGQWAKLNPPVVLGYDAAGIVEELGEGVTEFKVGDEVYFSPEIFGNQLGSNAEYNVVKTNIVAKKPKGLSFEEAAAIPLAGGTAWDAIVRRLKVTPGETVLIHGAAGGVGSFALQFAKAAGAKVIATASKANHSLLKELGADVVIDYNNHNLNDEVIEEANGIGVDAAFDIQGNDVGSRCVACTRPFGRIAVILTPQGSLGSISTKNITLHGIFLMRETKRLEEMAKLFERKQASVVIDEVLPLTEISKAHKRMDSQHGKGKIVIKI
jgi:NADPH:quinone reductase